MYCIQITTGSYLQSLKRTTVFGIQYANLKESVFIKMGIMLGHSSFKKKKKSSYSISSVHLLELLVMVVVCGLFVVWTFAVVGW